MKFVKLVSTILNMHNTDLDALARSLAFYDLAKAERLERLLSIHIREKMDEQAKWKEAA